MIKNDVFYIMSPCAAQYVTLHSVNASVSDSVYTFDLGSAVSTTQIELASVEFPMSQPPVGLQRNLVHVSTGVRLPVAAVMDVFAPDGNVRLMRATLPAHRNDANLTREVGGKVMVTTSSPHALWTDTGKWVASAGATLLCDTIGGCVHVCADTVSYVNETSFYLDSQITCNAGKGVLCTKRISINSLFFLM